MKRWIGLTAGIVISVIFLMIGFNGLHLDSVVTAIQGANLLWIIPGVLVYFLAVWGRTWRWHYMLRPIKRIPLQKLFPIVVIGYMGNNVYPFRAVEIIRTPLRQSLTFGKEWLWSAGMEGETRRVVLLDTCTLATGARSGHT